MMIIRTTIEYILDLHHLPENDITGDKPHKGTLVFLISFSLSLSLSHTHTHEDTMVLYFYLDRELNM
ncbi:hypothetical protein Hanom_Chr16g01512631 [Helianthus anomalus]